MQPVQSCLLFTGEQWGNAEKAIKLYTSLFSDSEIREFQHHRADSGEPKDTVENAVFTLKGIEFRAMDSGLDHKFTFTPAISIYVACHSAEELDRAWKALSDGGVQHMPIGDYGFSQRFGWTDDRFGVSWQLDLPYPDGE